VIPHSKRFLLESTSLSFFLGEFDFKEYSVDNEEVEPRFNNEGSLLLLYVSLRCF
jgi:hypothetical protein